MPHSLLEVIFYVFAGLTILCAFLAVTQSNPVRSVLFLVAAFLASSVLWMLAEAEFLALILVLVYVGAVMTLFLFVVMMLNIDAEARPHHWIRTLPLGLLLTALLTWFVMMSIPTDMLHKSMGDVLEKASSGVQQDLATLSNTTRIGLVLYTDYVYAFELAAVILLVAIVAAIMLVHREPIRTKRQSILQQLMTRREDRVRLVSIKAKNS